MKIEIYQAFEEKLLQDASALRLSPTQYINFLIENIIIKIPEQPKIVLYQEPPRIDPGKIKSQINGKDFINDF